MNVQKNRKILFFDCFDRNFVLNLYGLQQYISKMIKTEEKKVEQDIKNHSLKSQLNKQLQFQEQGFDKDANNLSSQSQSSENQKPFYQIQSRKIGQNNELVAMQRWKIADLSLELEDIILFCTQFFQSEIKYPLGFYTINTIEDVARNGRFCRVKQLWMENSILMSEHSKDQLQSNYLISFAKVIKNQIIPLISKFLKQNLSWSNLCHEEYNQYEVLSNFQREVINPVKNILKLFRSKSRFEPSVKMQESQICQKPKEFLI